MNSSTLTPVRDSNRAAVVHTRCLTVAGPRRQLVDTLAVHRWESPNFCNDNIRKFNGLFARCLRDTRLRSEFIALKHFLVRCTRSA